MSEKLTWLEKKYIEFYEKNGYIQKCLNHIIAEKLLIMHQH